MKETKKTEYRRTFGEIKKKKNKGLGDTGASKNKTCLRGVGREMYGRTRATDGTDDKKKRKKKSEEYTR